MRLSSVIRLSATFWRRRSLPGLSLCTGPWRTQRCEGAWFGFSGRLEPTDVLPVLCRFLKNTSSPAIILARAGRLKRDDPLLVAWCLRSAPLTWALLELELAWADAMTKRLPCWPPSIHLHSDPLAELGRCCRPSLLRLPGGAAGGLATGASGGGRMSTAAAVLAAASAAASMSSKGVRHASVCWSPRPFTSWIAWSTTRIFDLPLCDVGAAMHWCIPGHRTMDRAVLMPKRPCNVHRLTPASQSTLRAPSEVRSCLPYSRRQGDIPSVPHQPSNISTQPSRREIFMPTFASRCNLLAPSEPWYTPMHDSTEPWL